VEIEMGQWEGIHLAEGRVDGVWDSNSMGRSGRGTLQNLFQSNIDGPAQGFDMEGEE
jgi:hypothetical protein